jgi:ATP-dependent DNA ligase
MPLPRRRRSVRHTDTAAQFPTWIAPQLSKLVEQVPEGDEWAHEIKLDGYRMHARLDHGKVRLLTRTGLDWTETSIRSPPPHSNGFLPPRHIWTVNYVPLPPMG